ncbi:sporulation inhibitor of replication protein SirA [Virgibacillus soli]|uniref:Sporulation inhibitor of replication protein SirA n=1 Tax=Paracerasibacillus soli TaxID=480284 RepID=A0ABU5CPE6_9BACI|nr:sporulation inhibitor of replication protein SirA [Virgibacillus soli]MDY0408228.1 sporulation inhibitor of replication protein SirA [Virgibacillus soli]
MDVYSIYWIKEEIADHYFYKSDYLYRFFKAYEAEPNRPDLAAQFAFITKDLLKEKIMQDMLNFPYDDVTIHRKHHHIELVASKNYITLHMYEKHIKFLCPSLHDAEKLLFPVLKQFHPYLFIVGRNQYNYGWISLAKPTTNYEQVLYSLL